MNLALSLVQKIKLMLILACLVSHGSWANEESHLTGTDAKGSHGGRLFRHGQFSLELMMFERAMPPHFRAYLYENGAPMAPEKAHLIVQLKRFNGMTETISFIPIDSFLQSEQVIREPHSFDVTIILKDKGQEFTWSYSKYEGRLKIMPAMLKAAHIETTEAKSELLKKQLKVVGKITPNRDTLAPVYPRYSGIIKSLAKSLGENVTKGEVLVTIESNESLQNYNIVAPINGTVIQKYATTGELAKGDKPIYEIANLDNVWADLTLYRKDAALVKQGMEVIVTGDEGKPQTLSTVSYISPLGIEDSQTALARSVLSNIDRVWMPGMYVSAAIIIKEQSVRVAVPRSALQRVFNRDVVFVQQGDFFEAAPVVLGEQDDHWIEIKTGLEPGQRYVCENSFFLKAELGKDSAGHDD